MKRYKFFMLTLTDDQIDMIEGWGLTHWMKYKDEDDRRLIEDLLLRLKQRIHVGTVFGEEVS